MVAAFDYCLHGRGGAAPSIDTAMHGLVDARARRPPAPGRGHRVRDRRRRRGADQGVLRRPGGVGAVAAARVPARPGHRRGQAGQPAGDRRDPRRARHHRLGRHQRGVRGALAGDHRAPRRRSSTSAAGPSRSGRCVAGYEPLPDGERRARAAALAPVLRGLASTDRPQVGHFTDSDVVLDFLARAEHPRLAALGTSCPDHFLRTKVRPMVLDLPPHAPRRRTMVARLRELHAAYREDYAAYYERHADAGLAADARRRPGDRAGARRGHVLLRRATSRPPGWPASSTSTPST